MWNNNKNWGTGMIVAFTGHRLKKVGNLEDKIKGAIKAALTQLQPISAISGMAVGVDTWAAQVCTELQIPFNAYLPFPQQAKVWPPHAWITWIELLREATSVHFISKAEYSAVGMQKRNEAMVDDCHLLVAVWDGSPGGTANCVEYAKKVGRRILYINPRKL